MNWDKTALRSYDIRHQNEKLVLQLIQKHGAISQSKIVELTGLKAPTILRIFTNLEERQLIKKSVSGSADKVIKKGRRPLYFELNPSALFVIGVEFWAMSAAVVISNFTREVIYSKSVNLDSRLEGTEVLAAIADLIKESLKKCKLRNDQIIGVGIGAPGRLDITEGSVEFYSRIKGLNNLNIKDYFQKGLGLNVQIHNNTSVIALNEFGQTVSQRTKNIFALLLRGGVGGAYINEGNIVTSHNKTNMEIGHMSVVPDGRACSCGWKGCLETYLSEDVILHDLGQSGQADLALETVAEIIKKSSAPEHKAIMDVLQNKSRILAFAIKNICNLLSPNIFLIITRNQTLSKYFCETTKAILEEYPSYPERNNPKIIPVTYDPIHAGSGACEIVFQEYFHPRKITSQ